MPEKMKSALNIMAIKTSEFISKSIFKLSNIRNIPNTMIAKAMSSILQETFSISN
jgi:hypothetical protein